MALVKDNPLIVAASNVKIFAISLTNADSLLKLDGAGGIPFNNAAAQLVGTTLAAGVTPQTGFALTTAPGNTFNGGQTIVKGNGYALLGISQVANQYGALAVGRTQAELSLLVAGTASTGFPGTNPGDSCLIANIGGSLFIGVVVGQIAALKITGQDVEARGNLKFTQGKGIFVKEGGADARMGTVVMNGTTPVVVNTTAVTANSRIFFSCQSSPGTIGIPLIAARVAGVSFSLRSSLAGDVSTYAWEIREPSP